MKIYKVICIILALLVGMGCSNVRIALYDQQKRQAYAKETRDAFVGSEKGKELALKSSFIQTAETYIGTKYKYGSTDPKKGFDCSGLVYFAAKKNNIALPRSSTTMAAAAPHIPWKKAKPGDLVFFGERGSINHVGIVEKNNAKELWIIHSTLKRGVYREDVLVSTYWKKRILFAIDFTSLHTAESRRS